MRLLATLLATTALATPVLATDLVKRPVPSSSVQSAAPVVNWTGCWVRGAGGVHASNTEVTVGGVVLDGLGGDGFTYEAGAGCDVQVGQAVFGAWGRYGWPDADFTVTAGPFAFNAGVESAWAAGGRIGFASDRSLFYVLGGYGKAHLDWHSSVPLGLPALPDSNFWTVGGGFVYKATNNIEIGFEGRANLHDAKQWALTGVTLDPTSYEGLVFVALRFGGGIKLPD